MVDVNERIPFPDSDPEPEAAPAPEAPATTHDRLRAFEDALFGPNHVRPHGQIERGIGSQFSALEDRHKAHHAALEALIAAEAEHKKASEAAAAAQAKLDAAAERADETEAALDAPADEPAGEPKEDVANG